MHELFYIWDIHKRLLVPLSLETRLSFLIKIVVSDAGELQSAFLFPSRIKNNAKVSISFVLKISVVFFSTKRNLYLLCSSDI